MGLILNIDTSSKYCSVALAQDGEILSGFESSQEMDHSVSLAPFVEKALSSAKKEGLKLDAVSVIGGPGSYTGLRIGLSMAKGLAFSLNVPLIILSSLQVITVRAMFSYPDLTGNETIIPMLDAGRMEVYAGVYDCSLKPRQEECPIILDEKSFSDYFNDDVIIFAGNGSEKFKSVYGSTNAIWLGSLLPHAKYMATLSEKMFREKDFSDIAYSSPRYLKEYKTTQSKSRI